MTLLPEKNDLKNSKRFKNLKKTAYFTKIADIKILKNNSILSRSFAKKYKQIREDVKWLLRQKKPKNDQKFSKKF